MRAGETDLLIVGAGMAGLTAGARAARDGLSVTVTETGPAPGHTRALRPPHSCTNTYTRTEER